MFAEHMLDLCALKIGISYKVRKPGAAPGFPSYGRLQSPRLRIKGDAFVGPSGLFHGFRLRTLHRIEAGRALALEAKLIDRALFGLTRIERKAGLIPRLLLPQRVSPVGCPAKPLCLLVADPVDLISGFSGGAEDLLTAPALLLYQVSDYSFQFLRCHFFASLR